jgi:hypothetical protein
MGVFLGLVLSILCSRFTVRISRKRFDQRAVPARGQQPPFGNRVLKVMFPNFHEKEPKVS